MTKKMYLNEDEGSNRSDYQMERQKAAALGKHPNSVPCPACGKTGPLGRNKDEGVTCGVCGRKV